MTVPEGLRLAFVDLALTEASPLASAEVRPRPARGATGRLSLPVHWSHPVPGGAIAYRLQVLATPDGRPPPVVMQMTEPGAEAHFRRLVEEGVPIDLALSGPLVQVFHDQIIERGGQIVPLGRSTVAVVDDAVILAVAGVSLAAIAAICVLAGMTAFAAVIFFAISRGYNVDNAGYKVATGQGDARQEHQMLFNIRQPGT